MDVSVPATARSPAPKTADETLDVIASSLSEVAEMMSLGRHTVMGRISDPVGGGAYVSIEGVQRAYLVGVSSTAEEQRALAARIYQEDPAALSEADVKDAMGEVANILAGRVKYSMQEGAILGLPMFVEAGVESSLDLERRGQRVSFADVEVHVVVHAQRLSESMRRRRKAMLELEEREARLRSIMDNTIDGILAVDPEGSLESHNRGVDAIFGYAEGELEGVSIHRLIPDLQLDGPEYRHAEVEGLRKGGERFTAELSLTPLRLGDRVLQTGIIRDITARKEAERAVSTAHHRMTLLSRRAGMADVAANVLHSVGNALNTVTVEGALLREGIAGLRVDGVVRVAGLLEAHASALDEAMGAAKGVALRQYLAELGASLDADRQRLLQQLEHVREGVEQIATVVAAQERYSYMELEEEVRASVIHQDLLDFLRVTLATSRVDVSWEVEEDLVLFTDRHKAGWIIQEVLQWTGVAESTLAESRDRVSFRTSTDQLIVSFGHRRRIVAADLGHATLRSAGGRLHAAANAARELGGDLYVSGATGIEPLILDLPVRRTHRRPSSATFLRVGPSGASEVVPVATASRTSFRAPTSSRRSSLPPSA